jgi:hypothetical protein
MHYLFVTSKNLWSKYGDYQLFFLSFFSSQNMANFWGFLANLGYVSLVLGPIFLRQTWIPPTHHLPPSKEKIHVDVMRLHLH